MLAAIMAITQRRWQKSFSDMRTIRRMDRIITRAATDTLIPRTRTQLLPLASIRQIYRRDRQSMAV